MLTKPNTWKHTFQFYRDTRISVRILKLPRLCTFLGTVVLSMVLLYHLGVPLHKNIQKNALHSLWNEIVPLYYYLFVHASSMNSFISSGCENCTYLPYSWTHDINILRNCKNSDGVTHIQSVNCCTFISPLFWII